MDKNTLSHTSWQCKYHIVFAPKYRRQVIYGNIKADVAYDQLTLKEYIDPFTGKPVINGK